MTSKARTFSGVVIGAQQMQKTIAVRIDRTVVHPKYQKRYIRSQKYLVHDEKGQYRVGDRVQFVETRPLSKSKRWRVVYSA